MVQNRTAVRRFPSGTGPCGLAAQESIEPVIVVWSSTKLDAFEAPDHTGRLEIKPGTSVAFQMSPRSGVQVTDPRGAIARIDVAADHWAMSNFTASRTFVIENMEGGVELIKVPPRRLAVVVPFEISRVLIPTQTGVTELKVFGMPPAFLETRVPEQPAERYALEGFNEDSKYFLVLVALCETRLRRSPMAAVPSVQEVVDRLRPVRGFENANRSSINYHIDYLRRCKLPLKEWAMSVHNGRMHSKREALVSFALRHDLVREEHLQLLPKQTAPNGVGSEAIRQASAA